MRCLFALFLMCSMVTNASAESSPEATLDKYFDILQGQDFKGISALMDSTSMANLKTIMGDAMRYQANHGVYRLQRRIFGKKVSMSQVKATSAEFYLNSLASEILNAAKTQRLVVDNIAVLGRVDDGENIVHIVARLTMSQDNKEGTDVLVYTLIREDDDWRLKFPITIKQMLTVIETTARKIR